MKSKRTPRKAQIANIRVSRRTKQKQQRHVLDVKVRSTKEARLRRTAQAKLVLKVGGLLVAAVALIAAGKSILTQAVYLGDGVALQNLEVRTTGSLTRSRILETAKVGEGENLLNIDLNLVRDRLEVMPQVTSANVTRTLPDKLSIVVLEREAVAWLRCVQAGIPAQTSNGGHLVGQDGVVFRCDVLLGCYMALPVIDVSEPSMIRDGMRLKAAEYLAAMELVRINGGHLPRGGWEIQEIAVKTPYSLLVKYQNDALVTFGTEGLERQLGDVATVAMHAAKVAKHIATMNVMVERNTPVTFYNFAGTETGVEIGRPRAGAIPEADRRPGQVRGILGGA